MSEAEYEYAARAGTPPHIGGEMTSVSAWPTAELRKLMGQEANFAGRVISPEPFGLYDLNGNVLQWLSDCWNDTYEGAPTNGSAWETGKCERRVQRGGGWSNKDGSGFIEREENGSGSDDVNRVLLCEWRDCVLSFAHAQHVLRSASIRRS